MSTKTQPNTKPQVAFRLPQSLLNRIDREHRRLQRATANRPDLPSRISKTFVVERLLRLGLEASEAQS